jgi:predicted nucleotidyltransferase
MSGSPTVDEIQNTLRREMPRLQQSYAVSSLRIFGSRLGAMFRPDSDLDLLIRFHRKPGLLRFVQLEQELGDLLGLRVDLVLDDALKPHMGRRIRQVAVPI